MTSRQLAERIGNVDEDLVRHAEGTSGVGRKKGNMVGRILALAAALALAASTFAVGALAFSRETIVEVPVEPEHQIVELENLGLTLIFPDSWKDRYVARVDEDGMGVVIYCKAIYESDTEWKGSGCLFFISALPELMTATEYEEESPVPGAYLFATDTFTCVLDYPGDVQWPPEDEALTEEYRQMSQDARNGMKIVLNRVLL